MTRMTDECGALEYGATLHRPDPVTLTWAEEGRRASPGSHKASWLLFQILFGEGGLLMRHFRGLRQKMGRLGADTGTKGRLDTVRVIIKFLVIALDFSCLFV